ncbi:hypothetical protein MJO28_016607 [Puccinia striiformis f. sp. tritici]|uniref:Uncharacterized protein n=1 Tax=Puccinia striiformis f. sp. tritici TaxID=168172 RepID=A0ACC0DPF8_9BASI|nr:hypothetical protein MJO28_016607 [Puccinia striiformis f. sp. tritici]
MPRLGLISNSTHAVFNIKFRLPPSGIGMVLDRPRGDDNEFENDGMSSDFTRVNSRASKAKYRPLSFSMPVMCPI